jgi:hypothetical protein
VLAKLGLERRFVQYAYDLVYRIVNIRVCKQGMVHDFRLAAFFRHKRNTAGLDHFGHGDAKGLSMAPVNPEAVRRQEPQFRIPVLRPIGDHPLGVCMGQFGDAAAIGVEIRPMT